MRPLKFKTPEELTSKINEYFNRCDKNKKPYTISGLALHLDTSRQTLINYSNKQEFFDTIKRAKARVEAYAEEQLYRYGQVAGVIFNLKNNFGWKDDQNRFVIEDPLKPLPKETEDKILSVFRPKIGEELNNEQTVAVLNSI